MEIRYGTWAVHAELSDRFEQRRERRRARRLRRRSARRGPEE